ncbi:hypothetical protein [Thermus thermophilus]|uniref:hypothetical protein n=1 Tax=Thermus thermophilus TaxID=274 RepID=UPI001FCCC975|nr:hypothetical protein [Thermus thermophilus]BDG21335.1 hypothetical protein TthSNM17_09970 [Thermus thermophilus]
MLKEVQEVKVGGRMRRIHVRPFAWSSRVPLALLVVLSGLFAGCGRGAATATPSQSLDQSGAWIELAPGVRYWEEEGRVSLDMAPPLLAEESVQKFAQYARERIAQATLEEREFWEEQLRFVKEQHALWSDEELVVSVLENVFLQKIPLPLEEPQRQELRAKLREIARQLKRYGPHDLPPGGDWENLPPALKTPDGGMVVGLDTFSLLVQHLAPQSLFPSCSLAASAMPTTASPGAKAYATAICSTGSVIWGWVETQTNAWTASSWSPPCYYSGWPSSHCRSVAYGSTGCFSDAWVGYYYQWADLRIYSSSRSSTNSRCF